MASGARSKFGAPMLEPEVFRTQMYCIEESTCDNLGTFRRTTQWFVGPTVIRLPENGSPLLPLVSPLYGPICFI